MAGAARRPITVVVYDEGAQGASQLGGGQLASIALLAGLDRQAFRPVLLTSRDGELAAAARGRGVEVAVRDINAGLPRVPRRELARNPVALVRTLAAVARAAPRLAAALDELGCDVLNPNENLSRTVALLARAWRRTPCVIHIDNEWDQGLADRIMRFLFLRGFDRLIAVSERARRAADPGDRFRAKIVTIPTGIDPERFAGPPGDELRRELGAGEANFLVGTVGRLERLKGQAVGIEAVAGLARAGVAVRYILVGDGPERSALAEAARAAGLAVAFLGHRSDVPLVLAGLDALLHPSWTEAHPLVVIEALLAGLPVVATDVGGTAAILGEGRFGHLVASGDAAAMTAALLRLARLAPAERRRLGAEGRDHARKHFSLSDMVLRTADVYRGIAASRAR